MAVGKRQRLYSGVRMFSGNYLSSTPRELRERGVELELKTLTYKTHGPQWDTCGECGLEWDNDIIYNIPASAACELYGLGHG
jgi:hypothetical protein